MPFDINLRQESLSNTHFWFVLKQWCQIKVLHVSFRKYFFELYTWFYDKSNKGKNWKPHKSSKLPTWLLCRDLHLLLSKAASTPRASQEIRGHLGKSPPTTQSSHYPGSGHHIESHKVSEWLQGEVAFGDLQDCPWKNRGRSKQKELEEN